PGGRAQAGRLGTEGEDRSTVDRGGSERSRGALRADARGRSTTQQQAGAAVQLLQRIAMRERMNGRAAAIAGLCALVTAAVGRYFAFGPRTATRSPTELDAAAQVTQVSLSGALASLGRKLETEVIAAATTPQLRSAIQDGVDSYTLQDLFSSESWWTPYRERVCVVAGPEATLATHGENGPALADPAVLAQARKRDGSPEIAAAGGRPYLVSAASVVTGGPKGTVWLLFGQPLDATTLNTLAAQTGLVLFVSNG